MRSIIAFIFTTFLLASCGSSDQAGVSGTISGAEGADLYMDKFMYKSPMVTLAKIPIDGSGNFSHTFEENLESGIYRLRVGRNQFLTVLDSNQANLSLKGDISDFKDYSIEVQGSSIAKEATEWMNKVSTGEWDLSSLKGKLAEDNHPLLEMLVAAEAANQTKNREALEVLEEAHKQMKKDIPNSRYTKDMGVVSATLNQQIKQAEAKAKTTIGAYPPKIAQKDPEGNIRTLDDLKGKVVLLDFWASWCKPCRRANPMVVELYKKYNNQGFEVFNISLDKSKERWVKAIEQDGLVWPHHVSDLRGWAAQPAKDYGVRSIPKTFLLDRDGKIAAKNIRNKQKLEDKIKELL